MPNGLNHMVQAFSSSLAQVERSSQSVSDAAERIGVSIDRAKALGVVARTGDF